MKSKTLRTLWVHFGIVLVLLAATCRAEDLPGERQCGKVSAPTDHIDSATVTVDFAQPPHAAKSMSGFNHGAGASVPGDALIVPIQPRFSRTGSFDPAVHRRMQALGAREMIVLSDLWGYPPQGAHRWPYQDMERWRRFAQQTARGHKGQGYLWDIWNEPDHKHFWGRPDTPQARQQLFQTYLAAYRALRSELPEAAIGGPSITHFKLDYLTDFMEFADRNKLEVNFISWHRGQDEDIPGIPDSVNHVRKLIEAHPRLRTKEIIINEYTGPCAMFQPGDVAGYLYYLEKAGVDAGARSCWGEPGRKSRNCYNNSLNGLLEPDNLRPRSVWWLYKAYAEGVDSRLPVSIQGDSPLASARIAALPSAPASGNRQASQVLIGFLDYKSSPASARVELVLKNLPAQAKHFKIERIPLAEPETRAVERLETLKQGELQNANGSARLALEGIKLHEAYWVQIE